MFFFTKLTFLLPYFDIIQMFWDARAFDQDIGEWNTSSVKNMRSMFNGATKFNSNLAGWSLKSVVTMKYFLFDAKSYNQNLCEWRKTFPYNAAYNIFTGSGCTYQTSPQEEAMGPFCASDCFLSTLLKTDEL